MNPVEVFATVAQKQYALLEWLNAVDSSYRETEIEHWPQRRKNGRRGWTSHDVRRQQFAVAIANASLSNLPTPPRHMLTRVAVGLKILPSLRAALVDDAGNAAIRYCTVDQPQYTSVAEVVFELMVAHRDWVGFIAGNGSDEPQITDHYRDLCNELGGMRAMMNSALPTNAPTPPAQSIDRLSIKKIAKELAVAEKTVRRFADEGWLTLHKIPGKQRGMYAIRSEIDWDALEKRRDDKQK